MVLKNIFLGTRYIVIGKARIQQMKSALPAFSHLVCGKALPGLTSLFGDSDLLSMFAVSTPLLTLFAVAPADPFVPLLLVDDFCSFEQEEEDDDDPPFCCCTILSCLRNFARLF